MDDKIKKEIEEYRKMSFSEKIKTAKLSIIDAAEYPYLLTSIQINVCLNKW